MPINAIIYNSVPRSISYLIILDPDDLQRAKESRSSRWAASCRSSLARSTSDAWTEVPRHGPQPKS